MGKAELTINKEVLFDSLLTEGDCLVYIEGYPGVLCLNGFMADIHGEIDPLRKAEFEEAVRSRDKWENLVKLAAGCQCELGQAYEYIVFGKDPELPDDTELRAYHLKNPQGVRFRVQSRLYDYFPRRYPGCRFYHGPTGQLLAIRQGPELVGLLAPMEIKGEYPAIAIGGKHEQQ